VEPTALRETVRGGRVPLAREGYPLIGAAAAVTVLLLLAGWTVPACAALALSIFIVSFFRDPERQIPTAPGLVVSPADGRVIRIAAVQDDRFLRGAATVVSIFMSPLNVHVNRVPAGGHVLDVRYHRGKYFRAFADKASLDNEQNAIVMEDEQGRRFCYVQIAGFLARRIVCYLTAGMQVDRGQRCGMIMFGSRVDLYLPPSVQVHVRVGDRTRGGETVIAAWP
jgi:phosphatidylserine decarboxylase